MADSTDTSLRQFRRHPRDWRRNLYVYPVISRRSSGLSIGVNLNPDTACNFDCVYCQVDRSILPRVREVDPDIVRDELGRMVADAVSGRLFEDPAFCDVPDDLRTLNDIAFSGDGEPTTCKCFRECVEIVAALRCDFELSNTKIVLITDACYLTRAEVSAALAIMDDNNGEIWAKLDAGTEEYYRKVNRPNFPLQHVIDNIIAAAKVRPLVIQSLFMRLHDTGPVEAEITAYVNRLTEITACGGQIAQVQVYTIARAPAEHYVTPLADVEVDHIAALVRERTGLRADAFHGAG